MNRKKKNAAQQRQTSRELIDIQKITEYGLLTSHGELVFFSIEPTNLSVHSPESIGSRIYALMTVLKGQTEIEMLALNSKESFEDNKRHYRQLREQEQLPVIRKLLERDMMGLDRLQVQMATAREFFVLIRFRDDQDADFRTQLSRVQKSLEDDMPEDFYSIDLMNAYASLGRIIGEEVGDDLVNEIFSKFCMGK